MRVDLILPDLQAHKLTEVLLRHPLKVLHEITKRNQNRYEQGGGTRQFKNRKEEIIRRLQRRPVTGESFDQATDVVGRERLLLSLYFERFGRTDSKDWLPPFDNGIARSLLGTSGKEWRAGLRMQATRLFFTHFDKLTALPFLCLRLSEAYASVDPNDSGSVLTWHAQRRVLFDLAGTSNVAAKSTDGESLQQLMDRFSVPQDGRFVEILRQVLLLNKIQRTAFGEESPIFEEVQNLKNEHISGNILLGGAALKILVKRVETEGGRKWPSGWSRWITRFGCDPRYGRASAEGSKWWGWATDNELRLAQQGITGLTLQFFIKFLRNSMSGSEKEAQFKRRSTFLLSLFSAGKILNARLALNEPTLKQLDRKYHDPWTVALLKATPDQTSMVCLQCTDDIYIIEGTHNFGLRMFHRNFPIKQFWEYPREFYQDSDLRIRLRNCPVFLRHDKSGKWVKKFFNELRIKFHIEWSDVRI
jgi:hypothetical protein